MIQNWGDGSDRHTGCVRTWRLHWKGQAYSWERKLEMKGRTDSGRMESSRTWALEEILIGRWRGREKEVSAISCDFCGEYWEWRRLRKRTQDDWLCTKSVVLSTYLGNFSLSKSWNWFNLFFSRVLLFESKRMRQRRPSGFQLYLSYATKAKGCILALLSLFSLALPHLFAPHKHSFPCSLAFSCLLAALELIPLIPIQVKIRL